MEKPVAGTGSLPEAADEPVIAPAAADRAEAHRAAVLVLDLKGQLGLVDGAGVVFEAAHDGRVDDDAVAIARGVHQRGDLREFADAFSPTGGPAHDLAQVLDASSAPVRALRGREGQHTLDGARREAGALGEVAALVLAARAEEKRARPPGRAGRACRWRAEPPDAAPALSSPASPIASSTPSSTLRLLTLMT